MGIQLTPRLNMIAQQVTQGSKVADIGTDHGYLPIYLIKNEISDYVIASDVNEGPIKSAKMNVVKYKCKNIVTRLGSGLETITPGEVDTVIIAGMGGILITELLEAKPQTTQSIGEFILQPMQAQGVLRRYLVDKEFKIEKDILVKEDHKIYEILVAKKGKQIVENEIFYDIGFHIGSNPKELAVEFLNNKINKEKRIIQQIEAANRHTAEKIYNLSKRKLNALQEVLRCII